MTPAVTKPVAAPSNDSVGAALDNPELRDSLVKHALAVLGRRLADRPAADRMDRAKEACQETFARALKKRRDHDPAKPVGPWMHGIMNLVLLETIRSLFGSPSQASADPAAWARLEAKLGADPADVIDAQCYLAKLPAEHREVLQLWFFEDLRHNEIAVRLGISNGYARVRLCRALSAAKLIAGIDPREDRR